MATIVKIHILLRIGKGVKDRKSQNRNTDRKILQVRVGLYI